MTRAAIELHDVGVRFRRATDQRRSLVEYITRGKARRVEDFWAVRNVNLDVKQGSFHGVIGHNGAGKSTLLKVIKKIYEPTEGSVRTEGRVLALIELGVGFHPDMTGRENIRLNGAILGLSRKEIRRAIDEIIDFSGIRDFINEPIRNYSSGMATRLGFSIATHLKPDVLLIDEVLAVGDEDFQERCLSRLNYLRRVGCTTVLVSHSLAQVQSLCDEVTWLDHGAAQKTGDPTEVIQEYKSSVVADGKIQKENRSDDDRGFERFIGDILVGGVPFKIPGELPTEGPVLINFLGSGWASGGRYELRIDVQSRNGPILLSCSSGDDDVYVDTPGIYPAVQFALDYRLFSPGSYQVHVALNSLEGKQQIAQRLDAFSFSIPGEIDRARPHTMKFPHSFSLMP